MKDKQIMDVQKAIYTRVLRFRAWDYKSKKFMLKGFNIIGECTLFDVANQLQLEEFCELGITQSTGIKDRNGVEIYEGDVIENWGQTQIVKWHNYDNYQGYDIETDDNDILILGNIFENPELL